MRYVRRQSVQADSILSGQAFCGTIYYVLLRISSGSSVVRADTVGARLLQMIEKGEHLERMSRYTRCIAQCLTGRYELDDEAFNMLAGTARAQFDADCVAALTSCREQVAEIRSRFSDAPGASTGHEGYATDL